MKTIKHILIIIFLVGILVLPYFVFAETEMLNTLKDTAAGDLGPYADTTNQYTFSQILGTAVRAFLSLLGVIFIILMLYGGYNWMTAQGEEEKVKKAKDTIRHAIIGLIIVVGSYAIWQFILIRFVQK